MLPLGPASMRPLACPGGVPGGLRPSSPRANRPLPPRPAAPGDLPRAGVRRRRRRRRRWARGTRLRGARAATLPGMRRPGLRLRPHPLSPIVHTGGGHDFLVDWWPSPARGAASARRGTPGAWLRVPPTWSITSSHPCRCGNGCSRCPSACAVGSHFALAEPPPSMLRPPDPKTDPNRRAVGFPIPIPIPHRPTPRKTKAPEGHPHEQ